MKEDSVLNNSVSAESLSIIDKGSYKSSYEDFPDYYKIFVTFRNSNYNHRHFNLTDKMFMCEFPLIKGSLNIIIFLEPKDSRISYYNLEPDIINGSSIIAYYTAELESKRFIINESHEIDWLDKYDRKYLKINWSNIFSDIKNKIDPYSEKLSNEITDSIYEKIGEKSIYTNSKIELK